ncbi:MAG: hypothetical protein FJ267_14735 [Planctomycetes bacterium]|nr:hypothetical protein [Planctomycetota bacterium]
MNSAQDSVDGRFSSGWFPWNWSAKTWMGVLTVIVIAIPFTIRAVLIFSIPSIPEPPQVAALLAEEISEEENAFTEYKQATELRLKIVERYRTQSIVEPTNFDLVFKEGWKSADDAMIRWINDHKEALEIWSKGTLKQKAMYHAPKDLRFDTLLTLLQESRTFARLATLNELRCLEEGNTDEAWEWCQRTYRIGGHGTHRGCVIALLLGVGIHGMASQGIQKWAEHPSVTNTQLNTAMKNIQSDFKLYEVRSNLLIVEYLMVRNTMLEKDWKKKMENVIPWPEAVPSIAAKSFYFVAGEPERTIRCARHVLANQIREIDKPLGQRKEKMAKSPNVMLFSTDSSTALSDGELQSEQLKRVVESSPIFKQVIVHTMGFDDTYLRMLV